MTITHPKLIALKEYMHAKIDGTLKGTFKYSETPIPDFTPDEIMESFNLTGFLITPRNHYAVKFIPIPFEDYFNSK